MISDNETHLKSPAFHVLVTTSHLFFLLSAALLLLCRVSDASSCSCLAIQSGVSIMDKAVLSQKNGCIIVNVLPYLTINSTIRLWNGCSDSIIIGFLNWRWMCTSAVILNEWPNFKWSQLPALLHHLYYISQWQLITPSNGQKHCKTAEKRPIFPITCRLQIVSESRDF